MEKKMIKKSISAIIIIMGIAEHADSGRETCYLYRTLDT